MRFNGLPGLMRGPGRTSPLVQLALASAASEPVRGGFVPIPAQISHVCGRLDLSGQNMQTLPCLIAVESARAHHYVIRNPQPSKSARLVGPMHVSL